MPIVFSSHALVNKNPVCLKVSIPWDYPSQEAALLLECYSRIKNANHELDCGVSPCIDLANTEGRMNVGVCLIELRLPENHSLKGKRQVIKSIIARLQNKYNASVAEVDNQGLWQLSTLGIACVSNHRRHADETLSSMVKFVAQNYPDLELLRSEVEIFSAP